MSDDAWGAAAWLVVLSVGGVGAVGVGYSAGYFLGADAPLFRRLATLSLPLGVSVVALLVAAWLYRRVDEIPAATVLRWEVVGFVGLVVLGGWYPMTGALGTYRDGFAYLLAVGAGILAGVVLGLYDAQRVRIGELERYESIVESVRDGVFAVDGDGTVTLVNPALAEMLGADRERLEGADASELAAELLADDLDGGKTAAEALADLVDRGRVEVEIEPVDRGPTTCVVEVSSPAVDGGLLVGVTREVSRYKRLQQQLSVTNRILRHNLRTSTNLIEGHARIVEVDAGNEDVARRARSVREEAEDLSALADKARLLSEIIEYEYGSPLVVTDPAAVVDEAVAIVREAFPDATYEVDVDEGRRVLAHPQIARAVAELVENGVRHADADRPTVAVGLRSTDAYHEVRVADEGPGLPRYEREVLDREIEGDLDHGSGLGLWLVNWIVDISEGELRFEDRESGGSVVAIRLQAVDDEVAVGSRGGEAGPPTGHGDGPGDPGLPSDGGPDGGSTTGDARGDGGSTDDAPGDGAPPA